MNFNLFTLRRRLEILKGKAISWTEVARLTGLHQNTIYNLADNRTRRVDLETLESLLTYFRTEGLDIGISDLFVLSPELAAGHNKQASEERQ